MRLTALFFFAYCMQVSATGNSQEITYSGKNVPIQKIFSAIEKQVGFLVVYNKNMIKVTKPLTVDVQNMPLRNFLSLVLEEQNLDFIIENKTIILKRKIDKNTVNKVLNETHFSPPPPRIGIVKDQEGKPLVGATIQIKGLDAGTSTDENGRFILDVTPGQTLIISYVGFQTKEVAVNESGQIEVLLIAADSNLDQVVVIGYGTMKKADLTGAVSSVKGEVIAERNATQVSQALQGAIAGLMVVRDNNAPGSSATIRVRGMTTIGDNSPLILVDGVPTSDIDNINPADIDNISVLKDAASASIYGARAAAGVILITTKRAKPSQLSLDFIFNKGIEKPTEMPKFADAIRYMQMVNELRWNDIGNASGGEYPVFTKDVIEDYNSLHFSNPDEYPNTDWMGLLLKDKANRESYLLNITGGSQSVQSKVSLGYDKTDGLYIGKGFERFTARINNNVSITKHLKTFIDFRARRSTITDPSESPMTNAYRAAPVYAAIWSNGLVAEGKGGNNMYAQLLHGGETKSLRNQLGGRAGLEFSPIQGLKLTALIAPEINFNKGKAFRKRVRYTNFDDPTVFIGTTDWGGTSSLTETSNENYNVTTQFLVNYDKALKNHHFALLGGYENYYFHSESVSASSSNLTLESYPYLDLGNPNFLSSGGNAFENGYRSYFGRLGYDFKNKYLFQANIRFDASSRFHKDYRWGSFPSFSAGWVISNEPFMDKLQSLSFLKLRASWGLLGNERIGNYPYQSTINFANTLLYQGTNIVSAQTAAQYAYAIEDISWETTSSYNIGMDISFFNNRLNFVGDMYKKTTKDMLLALEIPDYLGYSNPEQNTGKMFTKGWELSLEWNDKIGPLKYALSANVSDFRSVLGDLGGIQFLGNKVKFNGSEFDEWFGYRSLGLFQTQEEVDNSPKLYAGIKPGDVKYEDISGPNGVPDGIISEYDKVLLGGSLPRYMYGGNINLNYNNIDFSITFQGVAKQTSQLTANMVQPYLGSWGNMPMEIDGRYWSVNNTKEQNLIAVYPRLTNNFINNNYAMSDYWLFEGSYFRLKNLVIGYTFPPSITNKVYLKGLRVYGSVSDILSANKYPQGWDPEVANTGYPITTAYNFGLSVKF